MVVDDDDDDDDDDCVDCTGIRAAVYAMKLSRNLKEAQRSAA